MLDFEMKILYTGPLLAILVSSVSILYFRVFAGHL